MNEQDAATTTGRCIVMDRPQRQAHRNCADRGYLRMQTG